MRASSTRKLLLRQTNYLESMTHSVACILVALLFLTIGVITYIVILVTSGSNWRAATLRPIEDIQFNSVFNVFVLLAQLRFLEIPISEWFRLFLMVLYVLAILLSYQAIKYGNRQMYSRKILVRVQQILDSAKVSMGKEDASQSTTTSEHEA